MFRDWPRGWWILPGFLLGSVFWAVLICFFVKVLLRDDRVHPEDLAKPLDAHINWNIRASRRS